MTNSDNTCLNASSNSSSPFHSFESELDPIMIAAHKQTANSKYIRWRYCSDEPVEPVEPPQSNSSHELNLIALGRTGDGKSSLLNDLIGKQVFKQKISAKSQTKDIQTSQGFWAPLHPYMHDKQNFGCQIKVIDTPGFGDSQNRDQEFFHIIQDAILNTSLHEGGIHCILLVFKINTSSDTIFKSIQSVYDLVSPFTTEENTIWDNILLVFTHVDIVNGNTTRYQSQKVALKTKVNRALKEKYNLKHDLPMLWISTQKYTCGFLKGLSECDCEKGNKYHSDCRRRLYEQVWKRRNTPFIAATVMQSDLTPTQTSSKDDVDSAGLPEDA